MELTIEELKTLVQNDEPRQLEFQKVLSKLSEHLDKCEINVREVVYQWRLCRGDIYKTGCYSKCFHYDVTLKCHPKWQS